MGIHRVTELNETRLRGWLAKRIVDDGKGNKILNLSYSFNDALSDLLEEVGF